MILVEQPSSPFKVTHRKIPKEVNNENLEQKGKHLERKILYFSLNFVKSCQTQKKNKRNGNLVKLIFKLTPLLCLMIHIGGRLIREDKHS